MREIEGLLSPSVNTSKKAKRNRKTNRKTTHIRLLLETKKIIQEDAKMNNVTLPEVMARMVKSYYGGPFRSDNL